MAHSSNVQTVVETPSYLALARKLFSESDMSEIVAMVAADPKCSDRCERLAAFARSGSGLATGARAVERVLSTSTGTKVFRLPHFITAFAKNEKANLTKRERNELKKRADDIFDTYRR
jgi:hypothetical protein